MKNKFSTMTQAKFDSLVESLGTAQKYCYGTELNDLGEMLDAIRSAIATGQNLKIYNFVATGLSQSIRTEFGAWA